jgi:hypothetical protein
VIKSDTSARATIVDWDTEVDEFGVVSQVTENIVLDERDLFL